MIDEQNFNPVNKYIILGSVVFFNKQPINYFYFFHELNITCNFVDN